MGITAQLADILDAIASSRTRTETLRTDIYGISAMANSLDAALEIAGRRQKLNGP